MKLERRDVVYVYSVTEEELEFLEPGGLLNGVACGNGGEAAVSVIWISQSRREVALSAPLRDGKLCRVVRVM